jgi:hypothetical protein
MEQALGLLSVRTTDKIIVAFRSAKGRAFAERKPTLVLSEPLNDLLI